jgi:perosamine synthetase
MYGHPTRMTKILEIAKKYNLKIVEDAAPAIGAEWEGKRCGSFGDFAGFSFQGAKLLVTGEGGMLVTSNEELFLKAKKIWDQGRNANSSRAFWIDSEGVKFKMSNVQAAVGLGQLQRADELIEMKRRIFSWYEEELGDLDCLKLHKEVEGARSIYWMSSLFVKENAKCSRDEMMSSLKEKNIDTRPVFPAISQYPIWNTGQKPQPIATLIGDNSINLPSGVCLSHEEVKYVAKSIRSLV